MKRNMEHKEHPAFSLSLHFMDFIICEGRELTTDACIFVIKIWGKVSKQKLESGNVCGVSENFAESSSSVQ